MGDAIHEAHIRAILAKRSPDQPPATFYDRFGTTELGWGLIVQPRTLSSERTDRRIRRSKRPSNSARARMPRFTSSGIIRHSMRTDSQADVSSCSSDPTTASP